MLTQNSNFIQRTQYYCNTHQYSVLIPDRSATNSMNVTCSLKREMSTLLCIFTIMGFFINYKVSCFSARFKGTVYHKSEKAFSNLNLLYVALFFSILRWQF